MSNTQESITSRRIDIVQSNANIVESSNNESNRRIEPRTNERDSKGSTYSSRERNTDEIFPSQNLISNYDFDVDEDIVLKNNYIMADDESDDEAIAEVSEYQSPPAYYDDEYYNENNSIDELKQYVHQLEDVIRSLSQKIRDSDDTIQMLVSVRSLTLKQTDCPMLMIFFF